MHVSYDRYIIDPYIPLYYFILISVCAKENTSITHLKMGERKILAVTAVQRLNSVINVCLYWAVILNFMYFANATGSVNGYFYYVYFAGNSANCQIKGLQKIIQFVIFISVFNKKWVIFRHIVPLKQNKLFPLFIILTLRYMSYLVYSVHQ